MAGEQTVDALLESLSKLKEQLGTLRLDKDSLQNALAVDKPAGGNSMILLESLATIREGASQKVIIDTMLRQIAKQCRGCCMVLLGTGSATVWLGPGFGLGENEKAGTRKLPVTVQEDSLVKRAAATGDAVVSSWPATETEEDIYRTIGMSEPSHMVLIPMTINGRVQAVIIGDEEKGNLKDPAAMAIIVATAATTIEHLPFRDRIGYSRFPRVEGDTAPAAAPARPELVAEPKPEEPVKAAAPPVVEEKAPEPKPAVEMPEPPAVEEPVEEPSAPEEDTMEAAPPATYGETVDSYSKELEAELGDEVTVEEAPATDAAPLTEAASFEETEFEIEVTDEDVSDVLAGAADSEAEVEFDAADLDQDATDMEIDFLESPESVDAPAPELTTGPTIEAATEQEETEVETPEETPEPAVAATEEKPAEEEPAAEEPASKPVEINYEAFGLTGYDLDKYDGDLRKQHEKAIRFARLLVSEIKLYNEDAVKQGRQNSDLLSRLKDDITRSEALYKQRINATIRDQSNYFHDEMVRQLAEGDESLMGE